MTVEHVEVLVEEPSAEAALRILLPRILYKTTFEIYGHSCKSELLQRLPDRLKGYASWLPSTWRIIAMVDRDDDDCRDLKRRLDAIAKKAGLTVRSGSEEPQFSVVNRIAVEELEAWYFGDWAAVRKVYPRVNATVPSQAKCRQPDAIKGGTWEAFERVLQSAGYFKTGLRKIEAARAIAKHMEPSRNTSPSFVALRAALTKMQTT